MFTDVADKKSALPRTRRQSWSAVGRDDNAGQWLLPFIRTLFDWRACRVGQSADRIDSATTRHKRFN
jgi:hypothetical protein